MSVRVFKTRPFERFALKHRITDSELIDAVSRAERGLIDADLGGGVLKQRLARRGQGRSGGFRSILLFRGGEGIFFVYGFAKKDRDNISRDELLAFRRLAEELCGMDTAKLGRAVESGSIVEVWRE